MKLLMRDWMRLLCSVALVMTGIDSMAVADSAKPRVTKNNNVMFFEYEFVQPDINTTGDVEAVTINGLGTYNRAGEPVIPVKAAEILIPPGMKIVEITSTASKPVLLPDSYRLAYGKKPYRRSLGKPHTRTGPDPKFLDMTAFWPGKYHDLMTVQTNRGYRIAYISLFPLQYSPKTGKIKVTANLRLNIRFADREQPQRIKPTQKLTHRLRQKMENPDTLISYDLFTPEESFYLAQGARSLTPLSDPAGPYFGSNYKYVVITNSFLADESNIPDPTFSFQALCASKIARDIPAGIVTTDWILANYEGTKPDGSTDDATKIRNFLIDAYQTWGVEYALLGGDKDIIPVRLFFDDDESIPADLYYGCVDPAENTFDGDADGNYGESNDGPAGGEVDLTAEIFTGRAAVATGQEVVNFVRKTLVYESTEDPYLDQSLVSGAWLGFGGVQEYSKPFCELIKLGSDLYTGHFTCGIESPSIPNAREFNVTTLYDADYIWSASNDLLPILNGQGENTTPQIAYTGDHGDTYLGMSKLYTYDTGEINYDHLGNLTNTNYFFFYDDSCFVGSYDYEDCFGEEITTLEHGAFATILNSRYGWGSEENNLDSPTTQFTREFFHSVFGEGILELGRAHQEAKESCLWRLYTSFWGVRYTYYQVNLFGDPELKLRVTKDTTCTENTTRPTTCGVGACVDCAGGETCVEGTWVVTTPCDPMCNATVEACNDLDDDCDGVADNGLDIPTTCGVGACAGCTGVIPCEGGPDTCDPLCHASVELCSNAVDDDCDGTSDEAECEIEIKNIVLPRNGGVLEYFTSEYGEGFDAADLTNEVINEDGWASMENPISPQEFVYSFFEGKNAILSEAVIHGGRAEGQYFSKDVEVWSSLDGTQYTLQAKGSLANSINDSVTLNLKDTQAKKVKLVITSGYEIGYWELAEFVVMGALGETQDNTPPIAQEQHINTPINTAQDITLSASDADNDALSYHIVTDPTHGSLSGTAPNMIYTPDEDYVGPDSFTFVAHDGQADSNIATISITVEPAANAAPVAHDLAVTTVQDTPKIITLNATDAEGEALSYRIAANPSHGTLTGTAPDVIYAPNENYAGPDSFTFVANDGQSDSNIGTVSITVEPAANTAPVAHDFAVTTTQGTAKIITLSASDADGDSLSYDIVAIPYHGILSGSGPNITYTPHADYTGADSFTFKVDDGTDESNIAMVSIDVVSDSGSEETPSLFGCSQSSGSQIGFVPLMLGLLGLWARTRRSAGKRTG